MMNNSIGAYLKDLRLRKGYSLERVSSETKISITILRKLELNELSTLPNITYVKGYVQNILKDLDPREQKILKMRFGLEDGVTHTLEEVGEEFGVTRERIRQIEAKALERIKEHADIHKLRDY